MTHHELDVTDSLAVLRVMTAHSPDILFNAAAYTDVDRAEEEPHAAIAVNSIAAGNLAAAAANIGARFVHLSTDHVFSGAAGRSCRPEDVPDPINAYGRSKSDGERAALAANSQSLIVRTSWLYGAYGRNFVRTVLGLLRERRSIEVVEDQVGTPTFAPGLAEALWDLAQRHAQGVFHYTDSGVISRYDFAVAIQEEAVELGLLSSTASVVATTTACRPTLARRPLLNVLDKSKTWTTLGKPAPHWRENLRVMLRQVAYD